MNIELNIERINFNLANLKLPIIIIIGPPGAGKTVVGLGLSQCLNWDYYDTDVLIEQATSMTVSEIFSKHKEIVFRQLEGALVNQMTKMCQKPADNTKSSGGTIISCGGGLPIPPQNFANLLKLGDIVCLQASASVLIERVGPVKHRPLLNLNIADEENTQTNSTEQLFRLEKLLSERQEVYAQAPYQIDTSNKSIEAVVATIRILLKL